MASISNLYIQAFVNLFVQCFYLHCIWLCKLATQTVAYNYLRTDDEFRTQWAKGTASSSLACLLWYAPSSVSVSLSTEECKSYPPFQLHYKPLIKDTASLRIPLPSLAALPNIIWLPQSASAIDAGAGLVIALSVIYYLNSSRTGFRRTDSMINRIILLTVSTGLATNIFGLLCFVCVCVILSTFKLNISTFTNFELRLLLTEGYCYAT